MKRFLETAIQAGKTHDAKQHPCPCGHKFNPADYPVPPTEVSPNPNEIGYWFNCPRCNSTGVEISANFRNNHTRRARMKCPDCLTDRYVYDGRCEGCGLQFRAPLDLPALLGVKVVDGVQMIAPLVRTIVRKRRVIYQREVTR